jgi:phage portal protein BeeE
MRVAATVAAWLGRMSGEALDLAPDLDQVPALAAERDAQWARVSAADFLSEAEKRSLLGLPAVAAEEVDG